MLETNLKKRRRLIHQIALILIVCFGLTTVVSLGIAEHTNVNIYLQERARLAQNSSEILDYYMRDLLDATGDSVIQYLANSFDAKDARYDETDYYNTLFNDYYKKYEGDMYQHIEQFDSLSDEQKAEVVKPVFAEILQLFDVYKEKNQFRFFYFVAPKGDLTWTFVFSGKTSEEKRGTQRGDVYWCGVDMELDREQYAGLYQSYNESRTIIKEVQTSTASYEGREAIFVYYPVVLSGKTVGVIVTECDKSKETFTIIGRLLTMFLAITACLVLCAVLVSYFLKRKVLGPIQNVIAAVDAYKQNPDPDLFTKHLKSGHTDNEIANLEDRLIEMSDSLTYYHNESMKAAEKDAKLKTELDLAAGIQLSALSSNFDSIPKEWGIGLFAAMYPAKEVGGDFYDFCVLDEDHLGMVVGDASGKGISGSMFMMQCMITLNSHFQTGLSPKEILENVNDMVQARNEMKMFSTIWLAIYEISTGKLVSANAGHNYPIVKRASGETELIKDKHGLALGIRKGITYTEHTIMLQKGDMLIQYTDGVSEGMNEAEEMYGLDRMIESAAKSSVESAKQCVEDFYADLIAFQGDAEQFDDITIMVLKV